LLETLSAITKREVTGIEQNNYIKIMRTKIIIISILASLILAPIAVAKSTDFSTMSKEIRQSINQSVKNARNGNKNSVKKVVKKSAVKKLSEKESTLLRLKMNKLAIDNAITNLEQEIAQEKKANPKK